MSPVPRPDASMTLLTEILERPLDPGYAAAAERREAAGLPRATGTRTPLLAVSAVVVGFLLVTAAFVLRPSGTTASRDKAQLIIQIQSRQAHGDDQTRAVGALRTQIQAFQDAAIGTQQTSLTDELARLSLATGDVAATGPGLSLTIDDAPSAQAGGGGAPRDTGGTDDGHVTSLDLQVICNGLWQAGAEAMSINGQRLTARSAIRFAGQAILVDYRPLTTPYVITAIGDRQDLAARFAEGVAGSYLTALRSNYAIPSDVATSARVEVPRSAALEVTSAQAGAGGIPSTATAGPVPSTGPSTAPPTAPSTAASTAPSPSEATP